MLNKNIKLKDIKIFIIIFFAFKISSLSYISSFLNLSFFLIQTVIVVILLLAFFIKKRMNKLDGLFLLFYLALFISTVINKMEMTNYIKDVVSATILYVSVKYGVEKNPKKYFKYASIILLTYTLINTFIAIYLYPNPMFRDHSNPIFFLGGDNTSIRIYLYSIGVCFANKYINAKKISFPLLSIFNLAVFSFLRDIGSGKVCVFDIFIGMLFITLKRRMPKDILLKIVIVNTIMFNLLMSLAKINFAKNIITNILHRDMTLTGRTIIWDITVNKFIDRPIIGHGMIADLDFQAMLGGITGINAHNTYLMILFNGGIILFIIFIFALLVVRRQFNDVKIPKWFYVFPILLFTIMVRSQVEGWDVPWLFPIMVILFYAKEIIQETDHGQRGTAITI